MRKHVAFYTIAFAILCVLIVTGCSESTNYTQPIQYNHKKHIVDAGLTCFDCHTRVLTHEKASIPNIRICKGCHEQPMTESKEEKKLVDYIQKKSTDPMDTGSPGARSRLFFPPATCVDRKSRLPHVSWGRGRNDAPVFQTVSSHQDGVLHRLPCQKPREHRLRNMSSIGPGSKT